MAMLLFQGGGEGSMLAQLWAVRTRSALYLHKCQPRGLDLACPLVSLLCLDAGLPWHRGWRALVYWLLAHLGGGSGRFDGDIARARLPLARLAGHWVRIGGGVGVRGGGRLPNGGLGPRTGPRSFKVRGGCCLDPPPPPRHAMLEVTRLRSRGGVIRLLSCLPEAVPSTGALRARCVAFQWCGGFV